MVPETKQQQYYLLSIFPFFSCFILISLSLSLQFCLCKLRSKMPGTTLLTQQLNNFIRSLREQGILDYHFDEMRELEVQTPCLVMEAITMFLRDSDYAIAELRRSLGAPLINYNKVTEFAYQLKGSSASVGGCRMALACAELRDASESFQKEGSLTAFSILRSEYLILRENFNRILQIEQAINAIEPRRGRH